jgi:hypothetical protein
MALVLKDPDERAGKLEIDGKVVRPSSMRCSMPARSLPIAIISGLANHQPSNIRCRCRGHEGEKRC